MKKVEAIIRPEAFERVKDALTLKGLASMTTTHVTGCGLQGGKTEFYRGSKYTVNLLPKVKVELVVNDSDVNQVVDIISDTAKTGEIGDGKIFIYNIEDAVRIRTSEKGEKAI